MLTERLRSAEDTFFCPAGSYKVRECWECSYPFFSIYLMLSQFTSTSAEFEFIWSAVKDQNQNYSLLFLNWIQRHLVRHLEKFSKSADLMIFCIQSSKMKRIVGFVGTQNHSKPFFFFYPIQSRQVCALLCYYFI